MVKIVVPKRFWIDHVDRACRCSEECPDRDVHEREGYGTPTGKGFLVDLTPVDLAELKSDARHYALSGTSVFGPEAVGLIRSARATLDRIDTAEAFLARTTGP